MADSIYSSAASSDVSSNVSDFTDSESVDLTGDELEERERLPIRAVFGSSSSLAEEDDENKKKWRDRMNTLDWLVP